MLLLLLDTIGGVYLVLFNRLGGIFARAIRYIRQRLEVDGRGHRNWLWIGISDLETVIIGVIRSARSTFRRLSLRWFFVSIIGFIKGRIVVFKGYLKRSGVVDVAVH